MNADNVPAVRQDDAVNEKDENTSATLEQAARAEHEFLREKLRRELKREPTEEELNEYERRHTEGY